MAAAAALQKVSLTDLKVLYEAGDPDFLTLVYAVVQQVADIREEANQS